MLVIILLSAILVSIIILIICVTRLLIRLDATLKLNSNYARKHNIISALISCIVSYDDHHGFTLNGYYDPSGLESICRSMNRFVNKLIKNNATRTD